MMDIKVIGMGCKTCDELYKNTCNAIRNIGLDCSVEKVEDLVEIVKLGVMSSPALMADGKLLLMGRSASQAEIESLLSLRK